MKKTILLIAGIFLLSASIAEAHVIVRPSEAGIGSFQTFIVGVPVEENIPTIGLKLILPDGLQEVTPSVKSGWKITVVKNGTGDSAKSTEIDWTGGTIPVGERDDFSFSAQVPSTPTSLIWKAYQTYQDGSVVSWDQNPSTIEAGKEGNPYSITTVSDDLSSATSSNGDLKTDNTSLTLSLLAFIFAILAFMRSRPKKTV